MYKIDLSEVNGFFVRQAPWRKNVCGPSRSLFIGCLGFISKKNYYLLVECKHDLDMRFGQL